MNLFEYVGERIRELRENYGGGKGISQEGLAKALDVATNTISRWETATNKPDLVNLDQLARFFGVSILDFFPQQESSQNEALSALLRTAKSLSPEDLDELKKYAEYRKARYLLELRTRAKPGRKRKERPE